MQQLLAHGQRHDIPVTHTIPAIAYYLYRDCSVYKLALG